MRFDRIANIFIILTLIFQSCSKTVFPTRDSQSTLQHPSALNGEYKNISLDSTVPNNTLWTVLTEKPGPHGFKPGNAQPQSYIRLTAKNDHKVMAELYSDSGLLDKKVLKGSIDKNAFRLKKRVRYFGLPFLYMTLSHYKLQLSKDDRNRLWVDIADAHGGMALFLSGGSTDEYSFTYEKRVIF